MASYRRNTTPRISNIANSARGQAFLNCFSHSKSTLPSSGAILTGTPPSRNTVGITGESVPKKVPTIAELLSAVGYNTACVSRNSYVSPATGLDRGFDRFKWIAAPTIHTVGPRILLRYIKNIYRHSAGLTLNTAKHATPFLINEVAKMWLQSFENQDNPTFLYLHYNEPHRPYYPPKPYRNYYVDEIELSEGKASERAIDIHYSQSELIASGDFNEEDLEALQALYDAEIAYTDKMIGRLFEYVQSLELGETVFVVTADHGDLFGELGLLGHNIVLHDGLINVPLVTHGLETKARTDDLIQHIDVMRTILELAGADTEFLEGIDLRSESRDYAIAQRGPGQFNDYLKHNPAFDSANYHEPALTAVRTRDFKLLYSEQKVELFKLPNEGDDVSEDHSNFLAELTNVAEEWLVTSGNPITEGHEGEFTTAMERQLEDLGYL